MKRGFTLIEVLVAGSILFVVTAAVVGLNNTLIQGTGNVADRTQMNRWAAEGLVLVEKIRDDRSTTSSTWLSQAESSSSYGFYKFDSGNILASVSSPPSSLLKDIYSSTVTSGGQKLESGNVVAYRVICIESVSAAVANSADSVTCNPKSVAASGSYDDGPRTKLDDCSLTDNYCKAIKVSLNLDNYSTAASSQRIIPAGNAVKVRSIVVWSDKGEYNSTEASMLLTNWRPVLGN